MMRDRNRQFRTGQLLTLLGLCCVFFFQSANAQSDDKTQQAIAFFNQGQDAHEKGDLAAARDLYGKALEILPEFPEAELQRGNAFLSLDKKADAEKCFRRALELREDWTLAMANLGSVLVDLGKIDEAEPLLTKAIQADDANSLALTALAELRLRSNADERSLKDILTKLNALAAKVRSAASLLAVKGAVEYKLGDRKAAKESADKALLIDPKLRSANLIAADVALAENDLDGASEFVRRLEASEPKAEETIARRSRILFAQGKKAESLALLESLSSPSESTKAMIVEIKDGDVADLTGLEAKILRTPNDANVLAKLCQGFRVKHPAKAVEYCRRASVAEPNEMSHAVGFGAALVQAKQYAEAVGLFRKLLTLAPEHATIRANLATALFQLKLYPEAKIEFRWLTEKQPQSPTPYYFLAIAHDQLGEYLDAMANYQQFLKLANAESDKLEIEKVTLRLPAVQKQIKNGKGKKSG